MRGGGSPAHRGILTALAESASKQAASVASASGWGKVRPAIWRSPLNVMPPTKLESIARATAIRSTTSPAIESPRRTRLGSKTIPIRASAAPSGSGSAALPPGGTRAAPAGAPSVSASRSVPLLTQAATPKQMKRTSAGRVKANFTSEREGEVFRTGPGP